MHGINKQINISRTLFAHEIPEQLTVMRAVILVVPLRQCFREEQLTVDRAMRQSLTELGAIASNRSNALIEGKMLQNQRSKKCWMNRLESSVNMRQKLP